MGRNFRYQGLAMCLGYHQLEATLKRPHGPVHILYRRHSRSMASIYNPLAPFPQEHLAIPAIESPYIVRHLDGPTEEALQHFCVSMQTIHSSNLLFPEQIATSQDQNTRSTLGKFLRKTTPFLILLQVSYRLYSISPLPKLPWDHAI